MNRRIKRINISADQIVNILSKPKYFEKDGIWSINNYQLKGLPEDYKVIGATYDVNYNAISLFIYSESFEELPIYAIVPLIEMEMEVIHKVDCYRKDEPYRPLL